MAHTGQRLNRLGEVMGEDSSVLSSASSATHPGQGGATHGVVDGLLKENRFQSACTPDLSHLTDELSLQHGKLMQPFKACNT